MSIIKVNLSIGLAGAHRVGKSTLAAAYADKYEMTYVPSRVSQVTQSAMEAGHDPSTLVGMIAIQTAILDAHQQDIEAVQGDRWISDRTALDSFIYTAMKASRLAETVSEAQYKDLVTPYMHRCAALMPYYGAVAVVQPGIPYVEEPGKPRENFADQVIFNTLLIGGFEVMNTGIYAVMPGSVRDLNDRVHWLRGLEGHANKILDETIEELNREREQAAAEALDHLSAA